MSLNQFKESVRQAIDQFPDNRLCRASLVNALTMPDYHVLLTTLFHQTYSGPYTFALASVNCDWRFEQIKEYLLRHAEEEHTHWRWVLDDLRNTGYAGESPRQLPPHPSTQAYIGLNLWAATQCPPARLAIAAVLEGIGATHGGRYGRQVLQNLKLDRSQASFLLSHAETDVTHSAELMEVLERNAMTDVEWTQMARTARLAGDMYRAMFDHADYSCSTA
ncbi:MAG: iron-containing redox enzyme family protein [Burkholderiaceae bacterium]